jgi:hypothetical protein
MTLQKVFDKTRRLTNTTTVTLKDERLLDLTNETYLDIQRRLAQEEIEIFGTIKKTDLIAGQANYQLPTDLLTILRLEVNYDDPTDNTKWVKVNQTDLANLPFEFYGLLQAQPKSKPLMDLFASQVFLFPQPTANQVNGIRLWYIPRQPEFTSASDEIPPILSNYWEVFAYGNAFRYFEEIGHPESNRKLELYEAFIQKMIEDLKVETIEPIKVQTVDYFNQGWL